MGPAGLAIDSATGRLYYTNEGESTIKFLNLNGGGGGARHRLGHGRSAGRPGDRPDDEEDLLYWANDGIPGAISFANLGGGGGSDLNTSGATLEGPSGSR